MRSEFVEVAEAVLIQNIRKMALTKNDDVIQTLPPCAPKIAFAPGGTRADRRDVTKLLRRPLFRWCSRNPNVNDFAGLDVDHEESEQRPKPNVIDLQEIAGPNGMVRQKCLPALTIRWRWRTSASHVSLDRAFGDGDPQLEKFAADALGSPEAILCCHSTNKSNLLDGNLRLYRL